MSSVNVGPEGIHPAPRHRFAGGHTRIVLSLLVVVVLLASITFTVIQIQGAHAQSSVGSPLASPEQVKQLKQQLSSKIHILPKVNKHSLKAATASTPAYNNIGTSSDTATAAANFDGAGSSYSEQTLSASGISPNQTFVYDGITFTWPSPPSGSANNYLAAGQVLPVTPVAGATTLGFLGAAASGPSTGNAIITYTDNTTKTFALTMSDWTLGGGNAKPANGNAIVTAMTSRNTHTAPQNVKTYVFYANVSVDSTKTVQSVTLPTSVNHGQIHIFAVGTRAAFTNPYNNIGMADDANPSAGNLDGAGNSFSFQSFIGAPNIPNSLYMAPGLTFEDNGVNFTWPDVLAGVPNNYAAQGQTIPVSTVANAVRVGFMGTATNGPTCGAAQVNYTDGSTQPFQLCFSDWTLGGLQNPASFGNTPFNLNLYRNTPTGQQNVVTFGYYSEVRVQSSKTVQSVTLPNQSHLHIFSVGASALEVQNNVGISTDGQGELFANFDGANNSYSFNALQNAGMQVPPPPQNPDGTILFNGISFGITNGGSQFPDNLVLQGQVIPFNPAANEARLAFLGSSTNGAQSGTATIAYTDGSTQAFQLGFNDWCTPFPLTSGDSIAEAMPYRNTLNGTQSVSNYLYYMQVVLQAGKTIANVTFPSNSNMHVYSIGVGGTYFSNAGASDDAQTKNANFDSAGNSYSLQALKAAGLSSGQNVTSHGVTFQWPAGRGGELDNYVAQGQVLTGSPVTSPTTLAFLGSATNGPSTGSGTVTYTDGTSETFSITLTDWCSPNLAGGNSVVAAMSYRNTPGGKQTIKPSIFYTQFTLQSATGKTVQSVTLPGSANQGQLHIFAIGFK